MILTEGLVNSMRDKRRYKKARVRKKIQNRQIKTIVKLIHKIHQRNKYEFIYGNLSRRELEKKLREG